MKCDLDDHGWLFPVPFLLVLSIGAWLGFALLVLFAFILSRVEGEEKERETWGGIDTRLKCPFQI